MSYTGYSKRGIHVMTYYDSNDYYAFSINTIRDSPSDQLTDNVILEIAKRVPHGKCHDLGVRLGFADTEVDNLLYRYQRDVEQVSRELLMGWKTCHGSGSVEKERLRVHLELTGLRSLAALLQPEASNKDSSRPIHAGS